MKHLLLLILLALLPSCASMADVRAFEERAQASLEEFLSGAITEEQYLEDQVEARAELREATEERIDDVLTGIETGPITGNPLADLVIGAAGSAAAAFFGINKVRDSRRRARGEKVALSPPSG